MPLWTLSLQRVFALKRKSAHQIFLARYGFKVGWVAARSVTAQMIELEASRNGPDELHISESMRAPCFAAGREFSVAASAS
jgi:hypothetical protein